MDPASPTSSLPNKLGRSRTTPSYVGLAPSSATASRTLRASSRKRDSKPELLLRRALHRLGLRYRVDVADLPGRPDIVFPRAKLVVFVDGDFWHGRDLERRVARLKEGHNAPYWVAKITTNAARDRRNDAALAEAGWRVLRFWETDVAADPGQAAETVAAQIRGAAAQSPTPLNGC